MRKGGGLSGEGPCQMLLLWRGLKEFHGRREEKIPCPNASRGKVRFTQFSSNQLPF